MITLTINGKDKTKQIVNMSDSVAFDHKGKKLTFGELSQKMRMTALDIAGNNYESHTHLNQN